MRPTAIAEQLGLAKATVSFHLKNLGASGGPYIGSGMVIEMLGRSGLRVSELCDLKLGEIRLQEGRFRVIDAKTEAGVREVQMTPELVDRFARSHGTAFDELLRTAKRQLSDADWATIGPRGPESAIPATAEASAKVSTNGTSAGNSAMARPGLEPGTPRFSVVCSTN